MSDKPFLTYESLVVKLRDEKKLTIPEGTEAHVIQLLKKCGYFFLVSGYKNLFKASDGTYLPAVTIDDLFALYQFDNTLRTPFRLLKRKLSPCCHIPLPRHMAMISSNTYRPFILIPILGAAMKPPDRLPYES